MPLKCSIPKNKRKWKTKRAAIINSDITLEKIKPLKIVVMISKMTRRNVYSTLTRSWYTILKIVQNKIKEL